jgi:hypothetical protein
VYTAYPNVLPSLSQSCSYTIPSSKNSIEIGADTVSIYAVPKYVTADRNVQIGLWYMPYGNGFAGAIVNARYDDNSCAPWSVDSSNPCYKTTELSTVNSCFCEPNVLNKATSYAKRIYMNYTLGDNYYCESDFVPVTSWYTSGLSIY